MNLKSAIAYLKRVLREDPTEPDMVLSDENSPCMISYSEDLSIFFLLDDGESFRFVTNSDIREAKLTIEDLRKIGIDNLKGIAGQIEIKRNDDFIYFVGNGNFEASFILVDEIWDDWLSEYCPNGYIAALPARDILAVADKDNKESIEKLASLVARIWPDGDHLLTKSLYERSGNKWIPLMSKP